MHTGDYLLQPTFQDMDVPFASGQKHYQEELLGHRFRVSSPSFFQVNTRQAEQMAELVMDQLRLDGSQTVVDAYAGVATFAVLMADRTQRVVAVEESAAAVADARVNVEGIPNVELRQARTEDVLLELAAGGVDAVLLDPPRAGCMPGNARRAAGRASGARRLRFVRPRNAGARPGGPDRGAVPDRAGAACGHVPADVPHRGRRDART